ncbi:MAG: xanthine dehydrogenase family protein subunit M [Gammaproteobacteria bacterium]|nr:MAG: xanthine dehydrogenase family protein subunit M [Gammaproteobacteria bacterium]
MYPAPFRYHRANSVDEAISLLSDLGDGARALAGGQTLLIWMKLRFDEPSDLVDLGRIPELSYMDHDDAEVRIGALTTHGRIAASPIAARIPIVRDCANGIADYQVRNRGTIGGSVAAGDPACDWPALLHTLDAEILCKGPNGERSIDIKDFIEDLYATALEDAEIVTGIRFKMPAANSAGAYVGFKRCAPAYPTATAGVQLTLTDGDICEDVRIALGSAGLTPIHAIDAEAELRGKPLSEKNIEQAAEAAVAACDPVDDQRGSPAFKRSVLRVLVKRAVGIAVRRCGGESVESSHEYY